jgi:hypothetical protein
MGEDSGSGALGLLGELNADVRTLRISRRHS